MTYPVWKLLEKANLLMDKEQCPKLTVANRQTAASIIETVLVDTENYSGFGYRDTHAVRPDCPFMCNGIVLFEGTDLEKCSGDLSRRFYYFNAELRAQKQREEKGGSDE